MFLGDQEYFLSLKNYKAQERRDRQLLSHFVPKNPALEKLPADHYRRYQEERKQQPTTRMYYRAVEAEEGGEEAAAAWNGTRDDDWRGADNATAERLLDRAFKEPNIAIADPEEGDDGDEVSADDSPPATADPIITQSVALGKVIRVDDAELMYFCESAYEREDKRREYRQRKGYFGGHYFYAVRYGPYTENIECWRCRNASQLFYPNITLPGLFTYDPADKSWLCKHCKPFVRGDDASKQCQLEPVPVFRLHSQAQRRVPTAKRLRHCPCLPLPRCRPVPVEVSDVIAAK